jgi:hypothetical protein
MRESYFYKEKFQFKIFGGHPRKFSPLPPRLLCYDSCECFAHNGVWPTMPFGWHGMAWSGCFHAKQATIKLTFEQCQRIHQDVHNFKYIYIYKAKSKWLTLAWCVFYSWLFPSILITF